MAGVCWTTVHKIHSQGPVQLLQHFVMLERRLLYHEHRSPASPQVCVALAACGRNSALDSASLGLNYFELDGRIKAARTTVLLHCVTYVAVDMEAFIDAWSRRLQILQ